MSKTREIACRFYVAEKECLKGREGTFYGSCQTCKFYLAKRGGRPARKDLRQEKTEKFLSDKRNWEL